MDVKDCNGNILTAGDSVIVTKDLSGKGFATIKRGSVIKNIRLSDDTENIEGKINGTSMVIKTMFVKKK